ncbi:MAG: hypothetical protein QOK38_2726, partial [Acidobacteriaceae bacterium]|nr:hypothetical protein [Acidobacteriaceae bacterium]
AVVLPIVATVVRRDIGSPSKDGRRAFLRIGREAAERQQYGTTGGHAAWYRQTPATPIPLSGETVSVTQAQQILAAGDERL